MNPEKIVCKVDDVGIVLSQQAMAAMHVKLGDPIEIVKSDDDTTVGFRQYSPLRDKADKDFMPMILANLRNIYSKTGPDTAIALLSDSDIIWKNRNWDENRRLREDKELIRAYALNKVTGSHVYSVMDFNDAGELVFTTILPILAKNEYIGAVGLIFKAANATVELYKYVECLKIVQSMINLIYPKQ